MRASQSVHLTRGVQIDREKLLPKVDSHLFDVRGSDSARLWLGCWDFTSFTHSLIQQYLLSSYYMPGTGAWPWGSNIERDSESVGKPYIIINTDTYWVLPTCRALFLEPR